MQDAVQRLRNLVVPDPLSISDQSPEACARRLLMALQLSDDGLEMMRMNLRRRHPDASEEELGRLFLAWLHHRPGAEHGDSWGAPRLSL